MLTVGFELTTFCQKMLTLGFEPTTFCQKILTLEFEPTNVAKKFSRCDFVKIYFLDKNWTFDIVCRCCNVVEKYSQSFEIDLQVINVNSFYKSAIKIPRILLRTITSFGPF